MEKAIYVLFLLVAVMWGFYLGRDLERRDYGQVKWDLFWMVWPILSVALAIYGIT